VDHDHAGSGVGGPDLVHLMYGPGKTYGALFPRLQDLMAIRDVEEDHFLGLLAGSNAREKSG
jgi:hypothetical protein